MKLKPLHRIKSRKDLEHRAKRKRGCLEGTSAIKESLNYKLESLKTHAWLEVGSLDPDELSVVIA